MDAGRTSAGAPPDEIEAETEIEQASDEAAKVNPPLLAREGGPR